MILPETVLQLLKELASAWDAMTKEPSWPFGDVQLTSALPGQYGMD